MTDYPMEQETHESQASSSTPNLSPANASQTPSTQLTISGSAPVPLRISPAKDLWAEALGGLSEEHRLIISRAGSDTKLDSLESLVEAAEQKKKECDKRRWVVRLNGNSIVLRDLASKIVIWVNKFKEVGDVAVNFDPVHAALPWAGVRFLLQVAVAEEEQMAALLAGLEKVANLISRCSVYEALFLQHTHKGQAAANLEKGLFSLYVAMLRFIATACKLYNKTTASRMLRGVLNLEKVTGFVGECDGLEKTVDIEAHICESEVSAERETKLRNILTQLREPILRIDSQVTKLCDRLDDLERSEILTWLSSIAYRKNHLTARQGRTDGTGTWLLEHPRYLEWRRSSASMILWLHGSPGAGKTKLVSKVVDNINEALEQRPNDEAFAYFYCDRNQDDRRDPELILSSLVRQLSVVQDEHSLQRLVCQLFQKERRNGFASGKLEFEQSQTLLAQLIHIYPQVTLVVDALDECDVHTRFKLIGALDALVKESPSLLKVFISSRPDRDIKHRFESGPNKEIRATDNRDDIAKYVEDKLATSPGYWQQQLSPVLRTEICEVLVDKSEGMFQWVSLQLAQLFDLSLERDIRERLGRLPDTLEKAYDEIYNQIRLQKGSAPEIANRAFQWIMCSCAPLSPAKLIGAICQDPETDNLNEVDVTIDFVLGACRNLLTVDKQLDVCKFSHLSVQEYCETRHWSQSEANTAVAKVCLSLLNHPECQLQDTKNPDATLGSIAPLNQYARIYWATHVQRCEGQGHESRLSSLLNSFLGSGSESGPAYRHWHRAIKKDMDNKTYKRTQLHSIYPQLSPPTVNSLPICAFGFHDLVLDWWRAAPKDIEQLNSRNQTLLQLASDGGHISVAQELIDLDADVNAQSEEYGSALQAAASEGYEGIVKLLLERGADVNAQDGYDVSALQVASVGGYEGIVKLLLEQGADVNTQGGEDGNALQAASIGGNEGIVKLLLEKGADVNAQGGYLGNALQAASEGGHEGIVKLLLEEGADVNTQGGEDGNALQAAASKGHENTVKLLLEKGADVNAQGGFHDNALHAASLGGHENTVKLLLEQGADVNAQGRRYGNPLLAAAEKGHEGIVKLLLEEGADVNAQGGYYGNALQAASAGRHENIVKLLLERKADVNAQGGHYGNALLAAAKEGHEGIVKLLLETGADDNAQGRVWRNALQKRMEMNQLIREQQKKAMLLNMESRRLV